MTGINGQINLEAARRLRRTMEGQPAVDRARGIRAAAAARSKAWIKGLWQATRGPGRLSTDEYFYYRLYEPALSAEDVARFVGKRVQHKLHMVCNDRHWYAACHDKALFYTALLGASLPIPRTVAVYSTKGRSGPFETLETTHDLRAFLAEPSNYPLFAKPADGIYSIGALSLLAVAGNEITLKGGEAADLDDLVRFVSELTPEGYLFQKVLLPHPALSTSFGDTLSSIRLLVLWSDRAPTVESAVIKIPRTASVADNYWRAGNMLGALDLDSGEILRVVTGHGADLTEVAMHPDTETTLKGLRVPQWERVVALSLDAARMFPGIRTQSWDVAVTESGPVLMELNFGGDLNLHQLAHRRGMLGPGYTAHLRRCGYKGLLPQ